jgi:hypothetical protein
MTREDWAKVLLDAHAALSTGYDSKSLIPYWALGCADAVLAKLAFDASEPGSVAAHYCAPKPTCQHHEIYFENFDDGTSVAKCQECKATRTKGWIEPWKEPKK